MNLYTTDVMSPITLIPTMATDSNANTTNHAEGSAVLLNKEGSPLSSLYRWIKAVTGGTTPHSISTGYDPAKSIALRNTDGEEQPIKLASTVIIDTTFVLCNSELFS